MQLEQVKSVRINIILEIHQLSQQIIKIINQLYFSLFLFCYYKKQKNFFFFFKYCCPEDSLELGQFRLLDVDNKVIVPVDTHIRLIVTGESFAPII